MSKTKTDVNIPVGWLRLDRGVTTLPGDWFWDGVKWMPVCRRKSVSDSTRVIRRCRYRVGERVVVWKSSGYSPALEVGLAIIRRVYASDHRGVQSVALLPTGQPSRDSSVSSCNSDVLAPVFAIWSDFGAIPEEWVEGDIINKIYPTNNPNVAPYLATQTLGEKVPDLSTMGVQMVSTFDRPTIAPQPEPSPAANVPESPDSSVDHSADANKMVEPKIVARYDTEGRDVTELPGLWSEDDTQYREVIEGDLASGPIDCEVRNSDSEEWQPAVLCYIVHQSDRPFRVLRDRMEDSKGKWPHCRIKVAPTVKESLTVDTPDPTKITIGYTVPNAYQADAEPITEPIQRKRVLYIAGPMRGIAFFNYPMFDRVAKNLREAGNEVISPADEDRKQDGFDPFANPEYANPDACIFPKEMDFGKTVRRCLDAVLRCDEIVLLPGWENSNGAVAELTLAMWLGKRVRQLKIADNGEFYWACYWMGIAGLAVKLRDHHIPEVAAPAPVVVDDDDEDEDILDTAARITRGDRNASYGPPDQDFRRTAGMWSALFASKLQDGEMFDPRDVAMAMILLKCSRESHQRKLDNWVDIAGYARCGSKCN